MNPFQYMRVIASVFALVGLAVLNSAVIGFMALEIMPCSWFGSSFEGACGYGAIFFVISVGAPLTAVFSAMFALLFFKQQTRKSASFPAKSTLDEAHNILWWTSTFWLALLALLMIYFMPPPFNTYLVSLPFLLIHCVFVFIIASKIKQPPVVWVAIAALLAPFGTIASFLYFRRLLKPLGMLRSPDYPLKGKEAEL